MMGPANAGLNASGEGDKATRLRVLALQINANTRRHRKGKRNSSNYQFQRCLRVLLAMVKRRNRFTSQGFMLIELIAAITILLILTAMALPLARNEIIRHREMILHEDLRLMREAIDRYKFDSDQGKIPIKVDTFGYPPDLQTLVDGVP